MPEITLYTKPFCPFCDRAKRRLEMKEVAVADVAGMGNREVARGVEGGAGLDPAGAAAAPRAGRGPGAAAPKTSQPESISGVTTA